MAYPSVSYTFSNGTVADGANVSTNFSNLVSGLSDGTKDLNMNAATFAGNLTANGNIVLGNASSDTVAITGIITLGLLSTLTVPIGAAATPSLNFTSSLTTGFSCATADTLIISTAATARITISSAGLITVGTGGVIANVLGAVTVPSYSFTGDLNTGMWSSAADTLNFSTAGAERIRVDSSGLVGIGITAVSPNVLHLHTSTDTRLKLTNGTTGSGATDGAHIALGGNDLYIWNFETAPLIFGTNNVERARVNEYGVGVGLTPANRNNCHLQTVDGIGFPATQVASSDVNTLDDYEEGTWTPSIVSGTGSITSTAAVAGKYTKVGNMIHLWFTFTVTNNGTGATNYQITGFSGIGSPGTIDAVGVAHESSNTGYIHSLHINAGAGTMFGRAYDNSYGLGTNATLTGSISFSV